MANDHDEVERTEAPSPRWLAHARDRGIWPRSTELTVACSIFASLLTLRIVAGPIAGILLDSLSTGLRTTDVARSPTIFGTDLTAEHYRPLLLAALVILVSAGTAAIATIGQVGFRFKPENLAPDLTRLSNTQNLERILSGTSLAESLAVTAKWTVLLSLTAWWLWSEMLVVQGSVREPESAIRLAGGMLLRVGTKVAAALVVFGCMDYARAWWTHLQQLQQSRAELTAELRESEGDPIVRRRRRQRQLDRSMEKRNTQAYTGNVVIVGNGRLAVALQLSDQAAATLVTKAVGTAADRLQRTARRSGVRVIRQDTLARSVFRTVQPGQQLSAKLDAAIHEHRTRRPFAQSDKY
jgi:flagellar biosynthesis protein FlhB